MARALSKGVWFVAGLVIGTIAGLWLALNLPPITMM
jgi:hypothetical protein